MFRRAFVPVAFCADCTCEEWKTGSSSFYFSSALASVDFDCENEIAHHLRGSAPAQPTVIWACQLRKDYDFDEAFMFICKCFCRRVGFP